MVKDRLFLRLIGEHFILNRIKDGVLTIEGDSEYIIHGITPFYKLSLNNCLSIINGYDLEQLSINYAEQSMHKQGRNDLYIGFKEGFNKAIELYKYTEQDLRNAFQAGWNQRHDEDEPYEINLNKFIKSFDKTECDVEIVTVNSRTGKLIQSELDLEWDESGLIDRVIPKLDKNGCIILKKV